MLCRETHLLCYYFLPQSHSLNIAAAALHPRCRIKLIACHFWYCLQCPFIGIFVQWQTFWSCLSNEHLFSEEKAKLGGRRGGRRKSISRSHQEPWLCFLERNPQAATLFCLENYRHPQTFQKSAYFIVTSLAWRLLMSLSADFFGNHLLLLKGSLKDSLSLLEIFRGV